MGYFDGDGCAFLSKNVVGSRLEIIGSQGFLEDICRFLKESTLDYFVKQHPMSKVNIIVVAKQKSVVRMIDSMYKDVILCLPRKFEKCKVIRKEYIKKLNIRGINV